MNGVIFIGLPTREKTTFYLDYFYQTHMRINRSVLDTRRRERMLLTACLEAKQPVVIDNPSMTAVEREPYIRNLQHHEFLVDGFVFDAGLSATSTALEWPCFDEGFDALYYVSARAGQWVVEEYVHQDENQQQYA